MKDIRLLLSSNSERLELRTLESSMRVLFKETRPVLAKEMPQVTIHRPIMSSKLLKKKKSCRDTEMNLMANSESVKKRLKPSVILWTT
jgi:hypothetical protein